MGAGEGTRGGHVIGHTKTGKALYEHRKGVLAGPAERASARVEIMQAQGQTRTPAYAKAVKRFHAMDAGVARAQSLSRATDSAKRGDHHHG